LAQAIQVLFGLGRALVDELQFVAWIVLAPSAGVHSPFTGAGPDGAIVAVGEKGALVGMAALAGYLFRPYLGLEELGPCVSGLAAQGIVVEL